MEKRCNICNEWDRHIYWNILKETKIQFWRPLRGNFKEECSIPEKFVRNFRQFENVIHLQGPSEKTWHVELKKMNGSMFFGDGWKDFVVENFLEEHDLLIFKYDGGSQFRVSIFDKNGCEKESAYFIKQCNHQNIFTVDEKDANASEDSVAVLPITSPKIHECSSTEVTPKDTQTKLGQSNHGGPRKKKPAARKHQGSLKHTSPDVTSDSDSYSSDQSDESKGYPLCSNSLESHDWNATAKKDALAKHSHGSSLLSQRKDVADKEVERALKRALEFQSDNYFFLTVMKPTHVEKRFFMVVPKQFAEEHLPCKNTNIILRTPHNKGNWVVNYRQHKCSSGFTGNWRKFVVHNNLKKGDVCVFELKMKNKDIIMEVHIFRVKNF